MILHSFKVLDLKKWNFVVAVLHISKVVFYREQDLLPFLNARREFQTYIKALFCLHIPTCLSDIANHWTVCELMIGVSSIGYFLCFQNLPPLM